MAKPNYQFEKRQKDLARRRKQEEKRQRKLAAKAQAQEGGEQAEAGSQSAAPESYVPGRTTET